MYWVPVAWTPASISNSHEHIDAAPSMHVGRVPTIPKNWEDREFWTSLEGQGQSGNLRINLGENQAYN